MRTRLSMAKDNIETNVPVTEALDQVPSPPPAGAANLISVSHFVPSQPSWQAQLKYRVVHVSIIKSQTNTFQRNRGDTKQTYTPFEQVASFVQKVSGSSSPHS